MPDVSYVADRETIPTSHVVLHYFDYLSMLARVHESNRFQEILARV